jgi:predicted AAA+ superfamily ATPase
MYITRFLEEPFFAANEFFPALLISGARQVGKTTFLRKIAEAGRRFVSLDAIDVRIRAKEDPRLFLADNPPPVIIDEIQYAPELLPYMKAIIDEARYSSPERANGMFWLTGSQQFQLMKGVTESLAGRIGIFTMHGLSNREIAGAEKSGAFLPEKFSSASMPVKTPAEFFASLWLGAYPELVSKSDSAKYWTRFYQSYVRSYLERDVSSLSQVADHNVFYAFLKAVAVRSGQMLNYSDLAREVGISQPTAKNYLSILQTSGIVKLLYPYRTNQSAPMVSTPKLYMLDTGLMAFLSEWNTPEALAAGAAAGHFFETWCFAEILKSYTNAGEEASLYYYRDKERDPKEIDIVIKKNGTLYPVEFKKAATIDKDAVRNFGKLATFKQPVGMGALVSLFPEVTHLREDVITVPATAL